MILRLSTELFDSTTPEENRLLRRLLVKLDESPDAHALLLEPEPAEALANGPASAWMRSLQQEDRDSFQSKVELGPLIQQLSVVGEASSRDGCWRRSGPLRVLIQRRGVSDWPALHLNLTDTLDLLTEPTHLRLENARNDRRFLSWLAGEASKRELERLEAAPGRIEVHGGGTGELERWLRPQAEREVLDPNEMRRLWKSWVMFDKDAGEADARESSAAVQRLVGWCEQVFRRHRIPLSWVCLQRREIEAYIPDSALRRHANRNAAKVLLRLRERGDRESWAWAFDMKKGLRGDLLPVVGDARKAELSTAGQVAQPHELKAPFNALDEQERRSLARGFGANVLNDPLASSPPLVWLDELGDEYDRGPANQIPREALIQSIFDRV